MRPTSIGQQPRAVLDEKFAVHGRTMPRQTVAESLHRCGPSFDMREVAGVAVDLVQSMGIDVASDILEVERRNPDVAPDVVGRTLAQTLQGDAALPEGAAVRVPHVQACRERPDPCGAELTTAEAQPG